MKKRRFSAQEIRQARDRLDLTQAEFAVRAGVSISTVSAWEQGRSSPGTNAGQAAVLQIIEASLTGTAPHGGGG